MPYVPSGSNRNKPTNQPTSYCTSICLEGLRKAMKCLRQDSRYPRRDSNRWSPECKPVALLVYHSTRSFPSLLFWSASCPSPWPRTLRKRKEGNAWGPSRCRPSCTHNETHVSRGNPSKHMGRASAWGRLYMLLLYVIILVQIFRFRVMTPYSFVAGYRSFGGKLLSPSSWSRNQEASRSVFYRWRFPYFIYSSILKRRRYVLPKRQ
jgi:hypothetical protein